MKLNYQEIETNCEIIAEELKDSEESIRNYEKFLKEVESINNIDSISKINQPTWGLKNVKKYAKKNILEIRSKKKSIQIDEVKVLDQNEEENIINFKNLDGDNNINEDKIEENHEIIIKIENSTSNENLEESMNINIDDYDYRKSEEYNSRLKLYLQRKCLIDRHNEVARQYKFQGKPFFELKINSFADKFPEEIPLSNLNDFILDSKKIRFRQVNSTNNPSVKEYSYLNWATNANPLGIPVISKVKNQGNCGACWALVTAAATEAAVKISVGSGMSNVEKDESLSTRLYRATNLPSLSSQQLIDCDNKYNDGCNGGNPYYSFDYVINHGLVSNDQYPYLAKEGTCQELNNANSTHYYVNSFSRLTPNNEQEIIKALEYGPVTVGMCGTDSFFLFYSSGIFDRTDCCTTQNHAMLIVGYGHEDLIVDSDTGETSGGDYWVILNSWGEFWGERGFQRMRRSVSSSGICGVNTSPIQAIGGYYTQGIDTSKNIPLIDQFRLLFSDIGMWTTQHYQEILGFVVVLFLLSIINSCIRMLCCKKKNPQYHTDRLRIVQNSQYQRRRDLNTDPNDSLYHKSQENSSHISPLYISNSHSTTFSPLNQLSPTTQRAISPIYQSRYEGSSKYRGNLNKSNSLVDSVPSAPSYSHIQVTTPTTSLNAAQIESASSSFQYSTLATKSNSP